MVNEEPTNGVRTVVLEGNHIAARFPAYFDNPEIWFAQIEAIFQISRISQETTKYLHLIANLPSDMLSEFQEHLGNLSDTAYSDLKNAILGAKKKPVAYHISQLLGTKPHLGDRKPSQMLREMKFHFKQIEPNTDMNYNPILRMHLFNRSHRM